LDTSVNGSQTGAIRLSRSEKACCLRKHCRPRLADTVRRKPHVTNILPSRRFILALALRLCGLWLVLVLLLSVGCFLSPEATAVRTLRFAGFLWHVRSGHGDPGANRWSSDGENVWVDDSGQLHLRIRYVNGRWYCSEVYLPISLGYGRYVFHVGGAIDSLKPMVVVGLFLYQSDRNELDIEFSRWADPSRTNNAQYVVWPADLQGHLHAFSFSRSESDSVHVIEWTAEAIRFRSAVGNNTGSLAGEHVVQDWTYPGSSREALVLGQERVHINLWLYGGWLAAWKYGRSCDQEIVVTSFEFTPLSPTK